MAKHRPTTTQNRPVPEVQGGATGKTPPSKGQGKGQAAKARKNDPDAKSGGQSPERLSPNGLPMPPLVPQPHGGALLRGGIPGLPSHGGRPANEFKRRMQELANTWAQERHAGKIVTNPDHPHFVSAGKFVADRGYPELAPAVGAAKAAAAQPITINFNFGVEGQRYPTAREIPAPEVDTDDDSGRDGPG